MKREMSHERLISKLRLLALQMINHDFKSTLVIYNWKIKPIQKIPILLDIVNAPGISKIRDKRDKQRGCPKPGSKFARWSLYNLLEQNEH